MTNVLMKKEEKITKYQPLEWELKQLYHQLVQVVPIVFGVTGVASRNQRMYLKKVPAFGGRLFAALQIAVILGTSILQAVDIYDLS